MPTPTVEPPQRTWTFNDIMAHFEARGKIDPPLTEDERQLAHTVAEAFYFYSALTEMPSAGPWEYVGLAFWMGISRVVRRRDGE